MLTMAPQNPRVVKSLSMSKVTYKHIWTNHFSKINKEYALVGTKTSNDDNKSNNTIAKAILQLPEPY